MKKIQGSLNSFAHFKEEGSRFVIGYGLTQVSGSETLYEWYEVYIYKRQKSIVTLADVKRAIIKDIDGRTDEKILNGYPFTPDGADEPVIVWLSKESQTNFSEAHRLQMVPVKFKLNEDAEGNPIYHTFETFDELDRFYKGGVLWINQCLNEGWTEKDSIDWSPYESLFPVATESETPNQ